MVKFFKGFVSIIIAFFVIVVKDLIGQRGNGIVYALKSGIVIGIEIVFGAFFDHIVIGRNDLCGFIGGIGIALLFKVAHNPCGRLIEAFIG